MHKRRIAASAALLLSVGTLSPTAAHAATATTIYVNNAKGANCSDSGSGTQANPYCTVQAAANAAVAGQTVLVQSGWYDQNITITHGGSAGAPITFKSVGVSPAEVGYSGGPSIAPAPAATISGASYVDIVGFNLSSVSGAAALIENASNVTIDSTGGGSGGGDNALPAYHIASTASNVTLSRNQVFDDGHVAGIQIDSGSSGDIITTNIVSGYAPGIVVNGAKNTIVTSNTLSYVCTEAIALDGASTGSTIENNVIESVQSHSTDSTYCAQSTAPVTGIEVASTSTSGTKLDYNVDYPGWVPNVPYTWAGTAYQSATDLSSATGQGAHDLNVDDLAYPNPSATSPSIDSADSSAPGELSTDYYGNARVDDPNVANTGVGTSAYYDRGAVEYEDPMMPAVSMNTQTGTVPATISATESVGTSGWATPTQWVIDFGDGTPTTTTSSPTTVQHTYTKAGTYTVTVTATDGYGSDGRGSSSATTKAWMLSSSVFHPVPLSRLLDTRQGIGAAKAPVAANSSVPLQIEGAASGTIQQAGVTAVVLNVTVTQPTGSGNISVYADGSARPSTSNLNFTAGDTIANQVIAPVGADGKIDFYNQGTGSVQLVADVVGYFGTGAGLGAIQEGSPVRILDTRNGTGGIKVPIPAKSSIKFFSSYLAGIGTNVLNVTVTNAKSGGFLSVYPDGTGVPATSNLNFNAGQTIANQVFVQTGADGAIDFYNNGTGTVDVIADLYAMFDTAGGGGYVPISPVRLLDTRFGIGAAKGAVRSQGTVDVAVYGVDGLPTNLSAVAANVTVTQPTSGGDIETYPSWTNTPPGTSTVNFSPGQTIPNAATDIANGGGVKLLNQSNGSSQLIYDVFGYYTN